MKTIILSNNIKAALECANQKGGSVSTMAIRIEKINQKELLIVSTEGHLMLVNKVKALDCALPVGFTVNICRFKLDDAMKGVKMGEALQFDFNAMTISTDKGVLNISKADVMYPDWRRVYMPVSDSMPAVFDPLLLAKAQKALNCINHSKDDTFKMLYRGNNAGIMTNSKGADVVIMPLRLDYVLETWEPMSVSIETESELAV
jgi:hypothetical protein